MIRTSLPDLAEHLRSYKVPKYSTVIVHSSLFHFGQFEGGVRNFFRTIEEVFDDTYTLVMPAFNWGFPKTKVWNYHTTKSQCGILTEHMRALPGTLRTIHPFHSLVARGPNADALVGDICTSSFGPRSAFEKLIEAGAYNLSLGSEFIGGATFCHYAEEALKVPYRFYMDFPGEVTDAANEKVNVNFNIYARIIEQTHQFVNTWEIFWEDALRHNLARYDRFAGHTPVFLMNVRDAHEFLYDRIKRDPYYVAKRIETAAAREA